MIFKCLSLEEITYKEEDILDIKNIILQKSLEHNGPLQDLIENQQK
jgi:hypothetical protein